VVNIDQRTDFQGEKITPSVSGVRQTVAHPLDPTGGPHARLLSLINRLAA